MPDEDAQILAAVRELVAEKVAPRAADIDNRGEFPQDIRKLFAENDMLGIPIPVEYGGLGGSFLTYVKVVEEVAKACASSSLIVAVQELAMLPILIAGNEEQKKKYLPKLASGEWIAAYALTESGSGSDAAGSMRARAEKRGDRWFLNGQKLWITNGAEAGIFVIFANVDPAAGYKGITAFIIERDFAGFKVGKKEDKLGIRASSTTELLLDDCEVPEENVLGPVGQGYKIAINTLNEGRIGIGAQMIGVAQGALSATIAYLNERKQFGKPLSDFQGIQFQVAQAATDLEAARLMVYNAARLKDAGKDIAREGAMAKLFSSQVCERVTSLCVELFGGYGYTRDYPVEKFYRDAKIGAIYEGTSNMQLQTIAKAILK